MFGGILGWNRMMWNVGEVVIGVVYVVVVKVCSWKLVD